MPIEGPCIGSECHESHVTVLRDDLVYRPHSGVPAPQFPVESRLAAIAYQMIPLDRLVGPKMTEAPLNTI